MATNLLPILRCAFFTPTSSGWGLPLLFEGEPGVGKSSIIEGVAQRFGLPCQVISPGEHGEGAFGVTPVPTEEGYLGYPAPQWTERFTERGIVFVDELKTAAPALQAPILGLILARRIGGSYLGSKVRVIGATNSTGHSAGGWDLSPPLANRLGHLAWPKPTEQDWADWLMTEIDVEEPEVEDAEKLEARVLERWPAPWAKARGLVASFVRARPSLLHKMPKDGHPDASAAWPSHRTWEFATRAIASAQVHGLSEADADQLVTAYVGAGAAGELVEYRQKADLPDPEALLDGKVDFTPDPKRLDRTYAVAVSATAFALGERERASKLGDAKAKKAAESTTHKRTERLMEILLKIADKSIDLVWQPAKQISKAGIHSFNEDSKKLMRKMMPVINDIGSAS